MVFHSISYYKGPLKRLLRGNAGLPSLKTISNSSGNLTCTIWTKTVSQVNIIVTRKILFYNITTIHCSNYECVLTKRTDELQTFPLLFLHAQRQPGSNSQRCLGSRCVPLPKPINCLVLFRFLTSLEGLKKSRGVTKMK